jgi:hypothetical protein
MGIWLIPERYHQITLHILPTLSILGAMNEYDTDTSNMTLMCKAIIRKF